MRARTSVSLLSGDATEQVSLKKRQRQGQLLDGIAGLQACRVGIKAFGTSHHQTPEHSKLCQEARPIPPAGLIRYLHRRGNAMPDAKTICLAMARWNIIVVPEETSIKIVPSGVKCPEASRRAGPSRAHAAACMSPSFRICLSAWSSDIHALSISVSISSRVITSGGEMIIRSPTWRITRLFAKHRSRQI